MRYRIGSFNCLCFGRASSKDIRTIANIICEEKIDIVALQEVRGQQALDRIIYHLNMRSSDKWNGVADKYVSDYAFIWNSKRIDLARQKNDDTSKIYEPRIWKQYKLDKTFQQRKLIREPYFARFVPKNRTSIEIRLINTHIRFSKGKVDDSSDENTPGAVQMRKNEFDILAKAIYPQREDKRYGDNRKVYTIMLGDYNLNLKRNWTKSPYIPEKIVIDGKSIKTVQDQLTTLKIKTSQETNENIRGYANNFDHFTYNENKLQDHIISIQKIDAVRKYYNDDFEKYRKEISDHVPIVIELEI